MVSLQGTHRVGSKSSSSDGSVSNAEAATYITRTATTGKKWRKNQRADVFLEKEIWRKLQLGFELITYTRCPRCSGPLVRKNEKDRVSGKPKGAGVRNKAPYRYKSLAENLPTHERNLSQDSIVFDPMSKSSSPPLTVASLFQNLCFASTGDDCGPELCGANGHKQEWHISLEEENKNEDIEHKLEGAENPNTAKEERIKHVRAAIPYCIKCRAHIITENLSPEQQRALQTLAEGWSIDTEDCSQTGATTNDRSSDINIARDTEGHGSIIVMLDPPAKDAKSTLSFSNGCRKGIEKRPDSNSRREQRPSVRENYVEQRPSTTKVHNKERKGPPTNRPILSPPNKIVVNESPPLRRELREKYGKGSFQKPQLSREPMLTSERSVSNVDQVTKIPNTSLRVQQADSRGKIGLFCNDSLHLHPQQIDRENLCGTFASTDVDKQGRAQYQSLAKLAGENRRTFASKGPVPISSNGDQQKGRQNDPGNNRVGVETEHFTPSSREERPMTSTNQNETTNPKGQKNNSSIAENRYGSMRDCGEDGFPQENHNEVSARCISDESEQDSGNASLYRKPIATDKELTALDNVTKREIAARVIGDKLVEGYKLTRNQCAKCELPLMTSQGNDVCVICPELIKRSREKSDQHIQDQNGTARIRVQRQHEIESDAFPYETPVAENSAPSEGYMPVTRIRNSSVKSIDVVCTHSSDTNSVEPLQEGYEDVAIHSSDDKSFSTRPREESDLSQDLSKGSEAGSTTNSVVLELDKSRSHESQSLSSSFPEEDSVSHFEESEASTDTSGGAGNRREVAEQHYTNRAEDDDTTQWWSAALTEENAIFDEIVQRVEHETHSNIATQNNPSSESGTCDGEESSEKQILADLGHIDEASIADISVQELELHQIELHDDDGSILRSFSPSNSQDVMLDEEHSSDLPSKHKSDSAESDKIPVKEKNESDRPDAPYKEERGVKFVPTNATATATESPTSNMLLGKSENKANEGSTKTRCEENLGPKNYFGFAEPFPTPMDSKEETSVQFVPTDATATATEFPTSDMLSGGAENKANEETTKARCEENLRTENDFGFLDSAISLPIDRRGTPNSVSNMENIPSTPATSEHIEKSAKDEFSRETGLESSSHPWKFPIGGDNLRKHNLEGWTIVSQSCPGGNCGSLPLRSFRGGPPMCVSCGYFSRSVEHHNVAKESQKAHDISFDEVSKHDEMLCMGVRDQEAREQPLSQPCEKGQSKDNMIIPPGNFGGVDRRRSEPGREMRIRIQNGWQISNSLCGKCLMPLMQKEGVNPECIACVSLAHTPMIAFRENAQNGQGKTKSQKPATDTANQEHFGGEGRKTGTATQEQHRYETEQNAAIEKGSMYAGKLKQNGQDSWHAIGSKIQSNEQALHTGQSPLSFGRTDSFSMTSGKENAPGEVNSMDRNHRNQEKNTVRPLNTTDSLFRQSPSLGQGEKSSSSVKSMENIFKRMEESRAQIRDKLAERTSGKRKRNVEKVDKVEDSLKAQMDVALLLQTLMIGGGEGNEQSS